MINQCAQLFLVFLRSLSGVILFDLSMRCIPHRATTYPLVSGQALVLAWLYVARGELPAAILILCATAALITTVTDREHEAGSSLAMAIAYVFLATEFVAAATRSACDMVGLSLPNVALQLWQAIVMWVYTRRLIEYHRGLALSKRGGPA